MDTKLGLAVPIIKNVEKMDILAINNELNRLLLTGKEGNFKPDDLTGGTFTLSNIGSVRIQFQATFLGSQHYNRRLRKWTYFFYGG